MDTAALETTGLDEIKERLGQTLAGGAHPRRIGLVRVRCLISAKQKTHTFRCGFCLVDDIGLEPMT